LKKFDQNFIKWVHLPTAVGLHRFTTKKAISLTDASIVGDIAFSLARQRLKSLSGAAGWSVF